MKKNSEVRIQESESRRSLRDAKSERGLANASLSVGDSDPRLIVRLWRLPLGEDH
ncbi:hypothetical protein [Nostoc sp.]|uniref:hypothetical protein n=1 Tax=Nostoc sp. TaxID=1180 RepID=UPI002FFBE28B